MNDIITPISLLTGRLNRLEKWVKEQTEEAAELRVRATEMELEVTKYNTEMLDLCKAIEKLNA